MIAQSLRLYRDAYRGLSPSMWLLAAVMLINRCGAMVLPYLTLYLTQHLHFSVTEAGLVMAIFGAGSLAGTFLGGRLTDRFGFHPVQFSSLFVAGVFLLLLQYVRHFTGICVSVFFFTLFGEAVRPANSAAVASYSRPEDRTRAYTLNRLAVNLGWSVGGGLGGYLASIDYRLLFWCDGLTCIMAALVLHFYLKPPAAAKTDSGDDRLQNVPARSPYRDRFYLAFLLCTTLHAMAFMQLFTMAPLYFKESMHLTEGRIGMLMTLNGLLVVFVEMALVYAIERRIGGPKVGLIAVGVTASGLAYVALLLGVWPGLAVAAMVLITFGEMLSMPFMQSFAIGRSEPQTRGQYMALYGMAYALAQITAPAFGSQIVAHSGFHSLWVVLVGLCVLSAGGFLWLGRQASLRS